MIVIYAEKPDMGKKIAAALGGIKMPDGRTIGFAQLKTSEKAVSSVQYKTGYLETTFESKQCFVTWGYGHLCGLKQAKDYNASYKNWSKLPIPFIPGKFELTENAGRNPSGVKGQLAVIKKLFSGAEYIINAADYDREGEVIFAYVYEYIKCKTPYKRAHFTDQTQAGIQKAFANLKASSAVKSVEMAGRARDIADWLTGCNITAQLSLKFPGTGVLSVGRVQTPTLKLIVDRELVIKNFKPEAFWAIKALFTTAKKETYKAEHKSKRFDTEAEANKVMQLINGKKGVVKDVVSKKEKREAPLLYSLSALQMDANEAYGFTLADTLAIAQSLYDGGYTTYPRTKSQFLNSDMEPVVQSALDALERTAAYGKYIKGQGRKIEKKIFDSSKVDSHFAIIPTSSVPHSLSPKQEKVYDLIVKSVIRLIYPSALIEKTSVVTDVNGQEFTSNGTTILSPGWLAVGGKMKEDILPKLITGEAVDGKYECKAGKTEPPKRYTDKTIVAAMKTAGKTLADAELKRILADPSVEGIGTEATRAGIIETLSGRGYIVRQGKQILATDRGVNLIAVLPVDDLKSAELTAKWEKRLSGIEKGTEKFDAFIKDISAVTGDWCSQVATLKGGVVGGSGGQQSASGGGVAPKGATGLHCPVCKSEIIKHEWGWGCAGYKAGCKFSIGAKICGKKISEAQVTALIKKGVTAEIKGFKSKAGKPFNAKLKLNNGKVEFTFAS